MLDAVGVACSTVVMLKTDVIRYFGSATKTARALGISKSAVSHWPEIVPAIRALQIAYITGGVLPAGVDALFPARGRGCAPSKNGALHSSPPEKAGSVLE